MRPAACGRRWPTGWRGEGWPAAAEEELALQPVPSGRAPPSAATCASPPGSRAPGQCGLSLPQRRYYSVRQLEESAFGSLGRGKSSAACSGEWRVRRRASLPSALPATFVEGVTELL